MLDGDWSSDVCSSDLHLGNGRFKAYSAGSSPRENQQPNPLGLQVLQHAGIATDGLHSKSWDAFSGPDAPHMDLIITVCDNAAGEVCPVWPGQPMTGHWGVPDPSAVQGSDEEKARAFWDTAVILKRRIDLMLTLPMASLDRLAIQREIRAIGTR
jgi:arsenate reductase